MFPSSWIDLLLVHVQLTDNDASIPSWRHIQDLILSPKGVVHGAQAWAPDSMNFSATISETFGVLTVM